MGCSQETTHHIIRSSPVSAARTIMETIALDKLISGYKKAKAIYVRTLKIADKQETHGQSEGDIFNARQNQSI